MTQDRIIAIGLLTKSDVDRLGANFARLWPITDGPCYDKLLAAIDEADRDLEDAVSLGSAKPRS